MDSSYFENIGRTPSTNMIRQVQSSLMEAENYQKDDGDTTTTLHEVNVIKFFLMSVNKDIDEVGLGKPLQMKDLDCLDHDTFVKLIVFLLTAPGLYQPEQLQGKTEVLVGLKDAGFPPVEYEANLDYIYHAAKRLFKDGDELLSYALLLKPQLYPKAAKEVLEYLTKFVIFTENCSDLFHDINVEVAEENAKRNDLLRQIAEVNDKIAKQTAVNDEKRAALPALQAKLNEMNADVAHEEDVVADLEREVAKYKKIYDAEEQEKMHLERKLEQLQQNRARLEAKLVTNPEFIQLKHKQESEKLHELIQEREEVGKKLDEVTADDQSMEELLNRGESLLAKLEACNGAMMELFDMAQDQKGVDNSLKGLEENLKAIMSNFKHLTITKEKTKEQNEAELQSMKVNLKNAEIQLGSMRAKVNDLKASITNKEKKLSQLKEKLIPLALEIQAKEQKLAESKRWAIEYEAELVKMAAELAHLGAQFTKRLDQIYKQN